jgi:hypothetical protein
MNDMILKNIFTSFHSTKMYNEQKIKPIKATPKKPKEILFKNFIKRWKYIYKSLPTIQYNNTLIHYSLIHTFQISKKWNNDKDNKIRETIIGAILNQKIPPIYFKYSYRWLDLKQKLNQYLHSLIQPFSIPIQRLECRHTGGRNSYYDFHLIFNGNKNFYIEYKFNAQNVDEVPQFISPMRPSKYLNQNYEEFYYDYYLTQLFQAFDYTMPDKVEYLNTIHSIHPPCMIYYQNKYYKGCKSSRQFTNDPHDIQFYNLAKKLSEDSIIEFIHRTDLNMDLLSNYLIQTQQNKYYMLHKKNDIYIQKINMDDYKIVSYIKKGNKYIATTKNQKKMNILLRWKNGNGIAYPAFQIS